MQMLALLVFCFVNIPLALTLYFNNPKSWTNRLFSLLIIFLTIYLYFNNQVYANNTYALRLLFARFIMFSGTYINLLVFLFLSTFPQSQIPIKRVKIFIISFFTFLLSFIALTTPYIFKDISISANNIVTPVVGVLMPLFMLHTIVLVLGGLIELVKQYKKSVGLSRLRLRYVFFAFLVLFFCIIVFNFLFPVLFHIGIFVPLLPIYILIFLIIVSYSIVRHRLLDIRLLVARAVSYTILVTFVATIYSISTFFIGQFLLGFSVPSSQLVLFILLTLFVAISFHPLLRIIERMSNKLLYKDRYESDSLLSSLSRIMASTLRLEDLTHGVLEEFLREVRIARAAFILLENDAITDVKSEGFDAAPILDEEEIKLISKSRLTLIFDELVEGPEKKIMRKLDISLVVHLRTEGTQVGLLIVGQKLSGDIYSAQDLKLLEILAPEVAVAIQNAKAYEEIRRFNITLQDEVNKATADLKSANVKLQELDHLKDEFVSLASHELRTPMTAIKGSISTILDGYAGAISKDAKEFLTAAYNENDRLLRLVNNLLNISRIEAGKFTFTIIKVDMNKLIEEVVHNLDPYAKEKSLYVKYDKTDQNLIALVDEDKVKEVLVNLIGNALKFTHQGGITVKATKAGTTLTVSVTDTGSGIAKEDQDLLFKKFSQVTGKNYAKPTGGTGLGLYISKQIVEGLKGRIWLESTLGKGSTFYFTVPLASEKL